MSTTGRPPFLGPGHTEWRRCHSGDPSPDQGAGAAQYVSAPLDPSLLGDDWTLLGRGVAPPERRLDGTVYSSKRGPWLSFIAAPFAQFFVRGTLIVPGDPTATAENIRATEVLFRSGFASDLSVFVIEVVQAAVLYVLLRPVSTALSLVMIVASLS